MRVLMRYADCPSCGRLHSFCLPTVDPVAPEYGYICPDTGQAAAVPPTGPWQVVDDRPPGAVDLSPMRSDWVSVAHARPMPGCDA
jgi:acetone carboxylase gamma subunit